MSANRECTPAGGCPSSSCPETKAGDKQSYEQFSQSLTLGIHKDSTNRLTVAELLRFQVLKSGNESMKELIREKMTLITEDQDLAQSLYDLIEKDPMAMTQIMMESGFEVGMSTEDIKLASVEEIHAELARIEQSDAEHMDRLMKNEELRATVKKKLKAYVDQMQKTQNGMYFITDESIAQVSSSPLLKNLRKRGLEVVYVVDPMDEYAVQQLKEFDAKKLKSTTKDNEDEEKQIAELKAELEPLTKLMEEMLGDKTGKVVVSDRNADTVRGELA